MSKLEAQINALHSVYYESNRVDGVYKRCKCGQALNSDYATLCANCLEIYKDDYFDEYWEALSPERRLDYSKEEAKDEFEFEFMTWLQKERII